MPDLVPGIHVFVLAQQGVDGRDKPGHGVEGLCHALIGKVETHRSSCPALRWTSPA
jgi:hypothetical protein